MRQINQKFWRDQEDGVPAYSAVTTTSGLSNEWVVTGASQNVDLLTLHSYQLIADPTGINDVLGGSPVNTVSGSFAVQVSMDDSEWTDIFTVNVTDSVKTGVLYADTWGYPFSRVMIGGMVDVTNTGSAAAPHATARSGAFTVREHHVG